MRPWSRPRPRKESDNSSEQTRSRMIEARQAFIGESHFAVVQEYVNVKLGYNVIMILWMRKIDQRRLTKWVWRQHQSAMSRFSVKSCKRRRQRRMLRLRFTRHSWLLAKTCWVITWRQGILGIKYSQAWSLENCYVLQEEETICCWRPISKAQCHVCVKV